MGGGSDVQSERSAQGVEQTARALLGLPAEWTILPDVVWPGRKVATIDHVVIGPGGVFVIDSTSWAGRPEVSVGARRRSRRGPVSAATACSAAADMLARATSLNRKLVHPVLCSSGQQVEVRADGVIVCTPETIVQTLLEQERVLDRDQVSSTVASALDRPDRRSRRRRSAIGATRQDRRSGSMGRLGVLLLVAAAVLSSVPWAAAQVADYREGDPPRTPALGQVVRLARTSARPPLELTPERVAGGGHSKYVVQVTVRNDGDRVFAMDSLRTRLMLDNLSPAVAVLPPGTELTGVDLLPGKTRVVTYRFTVPTGRTAVELLLAAGDAPADRVHWQVP